MQARLALFALIAIVQGVKGSFYYVGGSSNTGQPAVLPPATSPSPASRHSAATWSTSGYMWVFGGTTSGGPYCDLWKLSTTTVSWTYVGGPQGGYVYGKYNSSAGPLWPGSRWGASTWTVGDDLYLFGGIGCAATTQGGLNDLWKYSTTSNTWEFIKGPTSTYHPGNYTGSDLLPSHRSYGVSWTSGNQLYLFSGQKNNYLNDLWQFNVASKTWTWLKGSSGEGQEPIVSGAFASPGGRGYAIAWYDFITGSAWVYGGFGICNYTSTGTYQLYYLSDLWEFSSGSWYLRSGNVTCNVPTEYSGSSPHPGGRYRSVAWFDRTRHQLLLFGGQGVGSSASGELGDMWAYAVNSGTWSYLGGSTLLAQYGVYTGLNEFSGARFLALGVADEIYDRFWLWGGAGYAASSYGMLSDLWLILI